jgi:death-on-curing protein
MTIIDAAKVIEIHELILSEEPGLAGRPGDSLLAGALARVEANIDYTDLDDIYDIAAMYAVALARGHVFNDANKRTALVTALTYLELEGVVIPRNDALEEIMVDVAQGTLSTQDLAELFYSLAPDEENDEL